MVLFTCKFASVSEYLAITGYGISDVKLAKWAFIRPGQRCMVFDISPVNYTFKVHAKSAEKLPFFLQAVFTVRPHHNDHERLLKYFKLLPPHDKLSRYVRHLVQRVIRVLVASMTMEEVLLKGTKEFEEEVFGKVQLELNELGLLIYNANLKQLVDPAEARMHGEIGAKERDGMTRQNAAKIDAETNKVYSTQRKGADKKEEVKVKTEVNIFENRREAEENAELAIKKAEWARQSQVAEVEANKAVANREAELQMEVERRNALKQIEKLKAEMLSKAVVDDEMKVPEAEKQKAAEAALQHNTSKRRKPKGVNPRRKPAFTPANMKRRSRYTKQKEAEGLVSLTQGEARMHGEIKVYSTQRKGDGMVEEVKVKTDVETFQNRKEAEVAELERLSPVAQVEANNKAAEITEVEHQNALKQIERLKAEELCNVAVAHEMKDKKADLCYRKMKAADASLYDQEKEAEGRKAAADASLYEHKKEAEGRKAAADASLYEQEKEAEGRKAAADASLYTQEKEAEGRKIVAEGLVARLQVILKAVRHTLEEIHIAVEVIHTICHSIHSLLGFLKVLFPASPMHVV